MDALDPDEREAALSKLPRTYALAIRLRELGASDALVAELLGVEPDALDALFELAGAKLDAAHSTAEVQISITQQALDAPEGGVR